MCQRIFVPLLKRKHWDIAIMDKRTVCIHLYDSLAHIGIFTDEFTKILKFANWIKKEIKATLPLPQSWNLDTQPPNYHTQENSVDCGVILSIHAGFFARKGHMPHISKTPSNVRRTILYNSLVTKKLEEHDSLLVKW